MGTTENDRDPSRGERIKQLRIDRRLTQAQLAQAVGVTGRAYYEWENRGGPMSKGNLHLLAEALETTPAFLLTGEQFDPDQGVDERLTSLEHEVARLSDQTETDQVASLTDRISALEQTVERLTAAIEQSLIAADDEDADDDPAPAVARPVRRRRVG